MSAHFQIDEICCNFHWNPFRNLAVKFERFLVIYYSVYDEFGTLSSHSSTKSFTPHKYRSYLQMMPDQNLRYSKLPLIVPSRRLINLWLWTLGLSFGFKGPLSSRTGSRDDVTSTIKHSGLIKVDETRRKDRSLCLVKKQFWIWKKK